MNEKLIEYLQSCWDPLEESCNHESGDSKMLTYLYFACIRERLSLHFVEKSLNYGSRLSFNTTHTQKIQDKILSFRPYFDEALEKKKITSITCYSFPKNLENTPDSAKVKFINQLKEVENFKGIFCALLTLRNWAFFPEKNRGARSLQRHAKSYLGIVLAQFHIFSADKEFSAFLHWCGKRTCKILPFGFKTKELRSPPTSALPIYKNEAGDYVRYFLQLTCAQENSLRQHSAEMVLYLSLCLACALQYSNYFNPTDILKINKNAINKIQHNASNLPSNSMKDIREKSKGTHDALQLRISEDFLAGQTLCPHNPSMHPKELKDLNQFCKMVSIKDRSVLISQRLAQAIELMGTFSITDKDVENRLQKAYKVVGLSQSSGRISRRCFLYSPHYWEGVDLRENHRKKINPNAFRSGAL